MTRDDLSEVIRLLKCVRVLDCGAHYCRYCPARSPEWEHGPYCPYELSQKDYSDARALADRLAALQAEAPPPADIGYPDLPAERVDTSALPADTAAPMPTIEVGDVVAVSGYDHVLTGYEVQDAKEAADWMTGQFCDDVLAIYRTPLWRRGSRTP